MTRTFIEVPLFTKRWKEIGLDDEKGQGTARIKTYTIAPVKEYSSAEIRNIRMKAGMTQSVFAAYMGVSKKTVEAWEGGRTHPSGPAFRLLEVLASDNPERTNYVVVK